MLLLDIDNTISPAQITPEIEAYWDKYGGYQTKRAGGFDISIPTYTIEALQNLDDVYMLSTWRELASDIPKAFGFTAQTLDYTDYTSQHGIQAKFDVAKHFGKDVRAWADDHLTPTMRKWCKENNVLAIKPNKRGLTYQQAQMLKNNL